MLIHATITVTGDPSLLGACEARLRRLLSAQFLRDEVAEHHGAEALCYDFKIEGGIPFPEFAQASQEFPDLQFAAEWVNVAAGEKGGATIVNGRVTGQNSERVSIRTGDDHPVFVEVASDGRLTLALTLIRVSSGEWRGYALTPGGDALLRVLRSPGSNGVELYVTEGASEWAHAWRGEIPARRFDQEKLDPVVPIEKAIYLELESIVRRFVSDWIWFAAERREDIAVENERYARYGYAVSAANVRSTLLHRMRAGAGAGQPLVHSTLGPDELWVKDLLLATWAAEPRDP